MREEILKQFFLGQASASELVKDVAGSTKRFSQVISSTEIEDMNEQFEVTRPMLVSLCDAVLAGFLLPDALSTIGFALAASDAFIWDADKDDLIGNVISDWSCPEINYPLTLENVGRFRTWLMGVDTYPLKQKRGMSERGSLISVRKKVNKQKKRT